MPPQGYHSPKVGGGNDVPELINQEISEALLGLTKVVTTQLT